MIRPLIVAASVLASLPALAETQVPVVPGAPANCRPAGDVMATEAENPMAPQRLVGADYSAVLDVLTASGLIDQYDGALWYKKMGRSVLLGTVEPTLPGYVCFVLVPAGPDADKIIALMTVT